ncbi:envelope stress sensor histidine kinase CpxA [[Haemophilus] felis]|uniref:histidine kinase n=1 Tax=[Haemophilus] felis TaxID=123822 RepID=A0A1T0BC77_9PAST|nr:envelope stress sensor histidine kinase CpxA [[Haemophilus] felis]NBI41178.1 envelope stress sensor histidine kinase CpxA [[Haemophilus] felis]NBI42799.1 envelope stress sensor histidine kinase CpxA [[Haemophilus] felis]OOS07519.1 two-component system sensor histidine kinase CpxA [[Haemophilus] felis]
MPLQKESFFNTLSFRVFLFFWLTFSLLTIVIFSFPYVDSHLYKALNQDELTHYEQEIISSIRDKQIARILAGVPPEHLDASIVGPRPILVNSQGKIFGAKASEIESIRLFAMNSDNFTNPLKKTFENTKLIGPFSLHLTTETEESYRLFFIDYVTYQKEIVGFIFAHPAVLVGLIILISSPLLWWLSRSIARPIRDLQISARSVALGNFKGNKELETNGSKELRQVGYSFNKMTEALGEQLSNQRQLLSSISHELRTPLTRLQLALALLRRKVGDMSEITRIETETARLETMIHDLLLLSRQQLNSHLTREIFPIHQLWEEVLEDAQFEAEQRKINFVRNITIKNPERYFLNGNQGLLISAVENIVRNALKYTKDSIQVSLSVQHKQLFIVIDDNGAGLPETEFERIFQPFYRVDETRTRKTGGTGLGLAIVANVVKEHQGKVWAQASRIGGLCVTVSLPLWFEK